MPFLQRYRAVMMGCLYGIVFIVGTIGWTQTNHSLNIIDAAYRSLGLFLMASGAEPEPALLLNIARFAAPVLAAYTLVIVVWRVVAAQRALTAALRKRNSYLVLGEGKLAVEIATSFHERFGSVVIVGAASSDLRFGLRRSGIVWLEAVDDPTLRRLTERAAAVLIASESDGVTVERAKRLRQARGTANTPTYILFEDPNLEDSWLREDFETLVSIPVHLATILLRERPPFPDAAVSPPPIIIGEGTIAASIVRRIVTAWQHPGERMELHVAGADRAWVDDAIAGLEPSVNLHWHQVPRNTVSLVRLLRGIASGWVPPDPAGRYKIEGSTIYMVYENEAEAAPLALAISKHLPEARVVCLVEEPSMWHVDPASSKLTYHSKRKLIADPDALRRTRKDDLRDEIKLFSSGWALHETSPLQLLASFANPRLEIAALIAERLDKFFAETDMNLEWSTGVDADVFVPTPRHLDALACEILSSLGTMKPDTDSDVWSAALILASQLPMIVARTGGRVIGEASATAIFDSELIVQLSRAAHQSYLAVAGRKDNATASANAARRWNDLPEVERRSNVAQVVDIPLKLALIGMTMRFTPEPRQYVFSKQQVEALAKHEHRRWEHFQIRNGRYGHAFITPWENLLDDVKAYDRASVQAIPLVLAETGIEIVPLKDDLEPTGIWLDYRPDSPHPSGEKYHRTGIAWAWRLQEAKEWGTPRGDVLLGDEGDWWVVSEDGSSRTVKPEPFASSYELLDKQVYRRTGTIRARQVLEDEVVETLEGSARAEPGDWIATGPQGDRWPITAESFDTLYQPISDYDQ